MLVWLINKTTCIAKVYNWIKRDRLMGNKVKLHCIALRFSYKNYQLARDELWTSRQHGLRVHWNHEVLEVVLLIKPNIKNGGIILLSHKRNALWLECILRVCITCIVRVIQLSSWQACLNLHEVIYIYYMCLPWLLNMFVNLFSKVSSSKENGERKWIWSVRWNSENSKVDFDNLW